MRKRLPEGVLLCDGCEAAVAVPSWKPGQGGGAGGALVASAVTLDLTLPCLVQRWGVGGGAGTGGGGGNMPLKLELICGRFDGPSQDFVRVRALRFHLCPWCLQQQLQAPSTDLLKSLALSLGKRLLCVVSVVTLKLRAVLGWGPLGPTPLPMAGPRRGSSRSHRLARLPAVRSWKLMVSCVQGGEKNRPLPTQLLRAPWPVPSAAP